MQRLAFDKPGRMGEEMNSKHKDPEAVIKELQCKIRDCEEILAEALGYPIMDESNSRWPRTFEGMDLELLCKEIARKFREQKMKRYLPGTSCNGVAIKEVGAIQRDDVEEDEFSILCSIHGKQLLRRFVVSNTHPIALSQVCVHDWPIWVNEDGTCWVCGYDKGIGPMRTDRPYGAIFIDKDYYCSKKFSEF